MKHVDQFPDMLSATPLIVFICIKDVTCYLGSLTWSHKYLGILFEVDGTELRELVEFVARVLKVIVGEKAGEDVVGEELSQLVDHFVLHSLKKLC